MAVFNKTARSLAKGMLRLFNTYYSNILGKGLIGDGPDFIITEEYLKEAYSIAGTRIDYLTKKESAEYDKRRFWLRKMITIILGGLHTGNIPERYVKYLNRVNKGGRPTTKER